MFPFRSGLRWVCGLIFVSGLTAVAGVELKVVCKGGSNDLGLQIGSSSPSLGKRVIRPFSNASIRCLRMLEFLCLKCISYTSQGSVPSASSTAYAIANTPQSADPSCLCFTLLCRACFILLWDSLRLGV